MAKPPHEKLRAKAESLARKVEAKRNPAIAHQNPTPRRRRALSASLTEWLYAAARGNRAGRIVVFRFRRGTWERVRSWSVAVGKKIPAV